MIPVKKIISPFASLFPLKWLTKVMPQNYIFPLYHLVTDSPPVHIRHLYKPVDVKRFIKDLDFYLKHCFLIDPSKLPEWIASNAFLKHPGFLLTFDDGLREIFEIVAPILLKKGIPAALFVNNGFIDNKDLFYRYKASILIEKINSKVSGTCIKRIGDILEISNADRIKIIKRFLQIGYSDKIFLDHTAEILEIDFKDYLLKNQPYMNSAQLKDLAEKGFLLGAHGYTHQEINGLETEEMIRMIKLSVDDVNRKFSPGIKAFAFPFGDSGVATKVLEILHNPEKRIVDVSFGTAGFKRETTASHFQRLPQEVYGKSAVNIVKTEYLYTLLREIFGKNLIKRK